MFLQSNNTFYKYLNYKPRCNVIPYTKNVISNRIRVKPLFNLHTFQFSGISFMLHRFKIPKMQYQETSAMLHAVPS